jgi:hypothetical protein
MGTVPLHVRQASDAVTEYGDHLMLARENDTDDWVVLMKRGPEGRPFPVFNLGRELPAPEEIKRRLYMADVRRRGPEIVHEVERANEQRRKHDRDEAHDAAGELAEAIEWAQRHMDKTSHKHVYMTTNGGKK